MSCQGCLPIDCLYDLDDVNLYAIQGDPFLFIINCPPGYSCNPDPAGGTVSMDCCNQTLSKDFPPNVTNEQYQEIIAQLVEECAPRLPFCDLPIPPTPDSGGNTQAFYWNTTQVCRVFCADRNPFFFTVPAGVIFGASQALANAGAQRIACARALARRMCLSNLPTNWCADVPFLKTITATNASFVQPNFWEVTAGTLPTGVTFGGYGGETMAFAGTPTVPGSYTFTIRITNHLGDTMAKNYTICIIGQTCTPAGSDATHLPAGSNGTAYTVTVQATSCATTPVTWAIPLGGLPDGLTLDATTGIISGTPDDDDGDYVFTVTATSQHTVCSKQWTLTLTTTPSALTGYWTLDEAAGNRLDSTTNTSPLIPGGGVLGGTPALISNGMPFTGAFAGSNLATSNGPTLKYTFGNSMSLWGWFKINSLGPGGLGGPCVAYDTFQLSLAIFVGASVDPQPINISTNTDGTNYVATTLGTWHFFHLFYDAVTTKCGYSLDNGAEVLLPTTQTPPSGDGTVSLQQNFTGITGDVIFDEVGLLTTAKLTPAQVTYLYNAGAGRTWPIVLP